MYAVLVTCIVAASTISDAMAQSPPANITFWIITDRGNLFEIHPADRTPTTDVVSSPYVEFQRIGGVVVSNGVVREAAQYNDVGAGNTYVINSWADGRTYGIPNGAPLAGEMRLSPIPHLHLRTPQETYPGSGTYFSQGISHVEVVSGNVVHATGNHTISGEEYHRFAGVGRAIAWLNTANTHYQINMVCSGCSTDTRAVVGAIPDSGGSPASHKWGTGRLTAPTASAPCTVSGVSHAGCGNTYTNQTDGAWPLNPRPDIRGDDDGSTRVAFQIPPILNITAYDTTTCPGANSTNTVTEALNDTLFRAVSNGCIMEHYTYEWWDGIIGIEHSLPLRAGLNVWEQPPAPTPTSNPPHPAIILNMRGGEVLLQSYVVPNNHNNAFSNSFRVDSGHLLNPNSVIILHDAFAHLGAYTASTLHNIADHIRTYPQLDPEPSMISVAHSTSSSSGAFGGLLGDDCKPGYQYCITVFDDRDLPAIHGAAGVVYDPRNGVELNRGTDVDNHNNVFVPHSTTLPYEIQYDTAKLTLVQAYAVIPVSGHINVEELYIMAGRNGARGCDTYVDTTSDPHRWAAPPSAGWMRLEYLEREYGDDQTRINIPLLQWYDVVCMKTHGRDTFRQFNLNNFFVVGDHASFGGVKYIRTYHDTQFATLLSFHDTVLDTDVVLPGSGVRVMDMDVNVDVQVTMESVVEGGGAALLPVPIRSPTDSQMDGICDWEENSDMPQWDKVSRKNSVLTNPPTVHVRVDVDVQAPAAGGTYRTVSAIAAAGQGTLTAEYGNLPKTVGSDCVERLSMRWDFDPKFYTIPIEYQSNTPMNILVETSVWLTGYGWPEYANSIGDETIHIETFIDRLSVRVH